jgi:hypothetical protein
MAGAAWSSRFGRAFGLPVEIRGEVVQVDHVLRFLRAVDLAQLGNIAP